MGIGDPSQLKTTCLEVLVGGLKPLHTDSRREDSDITVEGSLLSPVSLLKVSL